MNISQLYDMLNKYENKELPVTITGNDSFCVDITNTKMFEGEDFLLLYENSYQTKAGKHLLSPAITIQNLLDILCSIKDKNMLIKGRGVNGVLISPTNCTISYVDNFAMLNLYDKSIPVTIDKAKRDAQTFIENLHID